MYKHRITFDQFRKASEIIESNLGHQVEWFQSLNDSIYLITLNGSELAIWYASIFSNWKMEWFCYTATDLARDKSDITWKYEQMGPYDRGTSYASTDTDNSNFTISYCHLMMNLLQDHITVDQFWQALMKLYPGYIDYSEHSLVKVHGIPELTWHSKISLNNPHAHYDPTTGTTSFDDVAVTPERLLLTLHDRHYRTV